ncbi:MAG: Asp-tRNA(Asn)/Glu-tRNA(Gln) amidotransferase subunit GatC [Spirochaetia bacterium]
MEIEELQTTAELAQLELKAEEIDQLKEAVSQMLENFAKMEEIDVSHLPPTTHALIQDTPLREDRVASSEEPSVLLKKAPERDNNFFIIPNVL